MKRAGRSVVLTFALIVVFVHGGAMGSYGGSNPPEGNVDVSHDINPVVSFAFFTFPGRGW